MNKLILALFSAATLILSGCKGGSDSAENAFGVKTSPDINISLMQISPSNKTLFIGESIQFAASGGVSPYVFVLDSGIGTVSTIGYYTAPGVAGTSVIKAIDAEGELAYATVSIAVQISISPTSSTINEGDTITFTGTGGIAPYTFSIVAGDGAINSTTGLYDSTGVSSGSAVVQIRDSSSNTAFAAITINPSLIISPQIQTISYGEQINFTATGGDLPYTYSILTGAGSVDSSTGVFSGPSATGSTVVRVTDSSSNSVDAIVTIIDSPQLNRPIEKIAINRNVTFQATNGSPPYTYAVLSGGGSIVGATGVFTAPSDSDSTVIQVTDNNGYTDSVSIPTFVPKGISTGFGHTCIIDFSDISTSVAKCWGRSDFGINNGGHVGPEKNYFLADTASELGDGLEIVDLGTGVSTRGVVVGRYSTCAVTTDDRLKCFGYNNFGQLGLGDRTHRGYTTDQMGNNLEFVDLGSGRTINNTIAIEDALSIQYHSACAILDDNSMKCWGYNNSGKLGHGDTATYADAANETGDNLAPIDFGGIDYPVQITVGHLHSCALLQNGNVKCWGDASEGQIGYETTIDKVNKPKDVLAVDLGTGRTATRIATGVYHTCAVLDNGELKCWGRNNEGQLGIGSNQDQGNEAGEMGDNLLASEIGTGKTAVDVAAMAYSTCAILNDASVKCWGQNTYGQLGIGSTTQTGDGPSEMGDVLPAVDLGAGRTAVKLYGGLYQMCAKLDNGKFKCWGRNNYSQLAQAHFFDIGKSALAMGDNLSPINISSSESILTIRAQEYTSCAVLSNNTLKCWGADYNGSRGSGASIVGDTASDMGLNLGSLPVGSNSDFKRIESQDYVTCGQTTDNRLACWGYAGEGSRASGNSTNYGFLADHWGDNIDFINFGTGRTVKDFDVSYRGGCAILDNDAVACWGRNDNGAVGTHSTADKGDSAAEVGDNFLMTDVGSVSTPVQISRGYYNSCARFANGKVKCWGRGTYGQNGVGNTTQTGDNNSEMGDNLPFIDLGTGINSTSVCNGQDYACSLFDNDQVKCWGRGTYGINGNGSTASIGDSAIEMGDNLSFIDFGTGRSVEKLSCGQIHACVILDNNDLKCWGYNTEGQLGQGSTVTIGDQPGEMGDLLPAVNLGTGRYALDVSLGYRHTCAVLDDNTVKCFGRNDDGQLGLGHRTDMGTLNVTMGDGLSTVDTE